MSNLKRTTGTGLWPISRLASVGIIGVTALLAAAVLVVAHPAEAVKGPNTGRPFGVELTDTLMSLDINDDGDLDDTGTPPLPSPNVAGDKDVPVVSGYTFTVRSDQPLTAGTTITVAFPAGVDLTSAAGSPANYEIYDPVDMAFEAATAVVVAATAAPVFGGTATLTPGNLAAAIASNQNITIRINQAEGIRNPATSFCKPQGTVDCAEALKLTVTTSADATPATSKEFAVGSRISLFPRDPGATSEIRVDFWAPNDVTAEDGKVILTFENDFSAAGFPLAIDKSQIKIKADRIKDGGDIITAAVTGSGPRPNKVANPSANPAIDIVGPANDEPQLIITVPDMDPAETSTNSGPQNIAKNALVTVTLSIGAGIPLPTEAATAHQIEEFRSHSIVARTTDAQGRDDPTRDFRTELHLPRVLDLDSDAEASGGTVGVQGKGFKNLTQVTVFLDANGDGILQTSESELASAAVLDNGSFAASFIMDSRFSSLAGNKINAVDGEGNSICSFAYGSADACNKSGITGDPLPEVALDPSVLVDPDSGSPGDEINITLRDFPAGDAVTRVTLRGVEVLSSTGVTLTGVTDPQGGLTLRAQVPNNVPEGVHTLFVSTADNDQTVDFTVGGADLVLIPKTAVPNQAFTINGSGFTIGAGAVVCEDKITIGGNPVTLATDSEDGSGGLCPAGVKFVNVTSGGGFVAIALVPVTRTILAAGRNSAGLEVKIIDSGGRSAIASLEIARSALSVTPLQSGTLSTVTVRGSGFPSDNFNGVPEYSAQVTINYVHDKGKRTETAVPDGAGNFEATLTVPNNVPIPSDNTIEAQVTGTDGAISTTTTIHRVSAGAIFVEPVTSPSGGAVRITGTGFKAFTPVTSIQFGGLGALDLPLVTDAEGGFELDNLVAPDLPPGPHRVEVRVGEVSTSAAIQITGDPVFGSAGAAGGRSARPAAALGSLEASLVRVFHFNSATKEWTFFDPAPGIVAASTLVDLADGEPYWVKVRGTVTVTLNGKERVLSCADESDEDTCWNLIAW